VTYHCEDEVEILIQNLAQWAGDGAAVRTAPSILQRLLAELTKGSGPVVTLGVDAGYTKVALKQIGDELATALVEYHLSAYPIYHQAQKLGIAQSTYRRRLESGHVEFMAAYHAARRASKL
jgi:hypothetical protein